MQFNLRRRERGVTARKYLHGRSQARRSVGRRLLLELLETRTMLAATPNVGILLLDHSGLGALTSAGNGGVHVSGDGAIVIDSNNSKAGLDAGKGNVSATEIDVAGGLKTTSTGKFQGSIVQQAATVDPLVALPIPAVTTPTKKAVNATGKTVLTLSPGTYVGGIHVSGNANVTLLPGVYYLQSGGLQVIGNGKLSGTGVTIYNGPKKTADQIIFAGNETVNLTAPNTGTYQNILIFQDRASIVPMVVSGGNVNLVGKVYAAKAGLIFSGTKSFNIGGSAPLGITGELIVSDLITSSSGSLNVDATNNAMADLAISVTDGTGTAVPGSSTTYTISVTNNGPADANGASIGDAFPAAITSDSYTVVGSAGTAISNPGGTGEISDVVDIAPGGTITYTVIAQIDPSVTGSLTDTATVAPPSNLTDPNTANNLSSDTDTLSPQADLSVLLTDGTTSAVPGTSNTYTATVTNNGPSTIASLNLTETLPSGFSNVVFTPSTGSYDSSSHLWSGLNLASGQSLTMSISGTIDAAVVGALSNTATVTAPAGVTDTNSGNNTSTDTDVLTPQAELTISKTDGVTSVVPGETDSYTIVVSNSGPSNAFNVQVVDTPPSQGLANVTSPNLPAGATFNSATDTWIIGSLAAGQSVTLKLTGTVPASATGSFSNTATATSSDAMSVTATDTDTLTPQADLAVAVTDDQGGSSITSVQGSVVAGTSIIYTIVVSNNGPSDVVGATISDPLLASPVFTSDTFTAVGTNATGFSAAGTGNINDTVNIQAGGSITYTQTVQIDPSSRGSLSNLVRATAPAGITDTNTSNNLAFSIDVLTQLVDVSVTISDGQTTAVPGATNTYTITVTNNGPSNFGAIFPGANVIVQLPASITSDSYSVTGSADTEFFPSTGTGNISQLVDIPAGGHITYVVTCNISASATGTLSITATFDPQTTTDTNPANNSATDTDTLRSCFKTSDTVMAVVWRR